MLYWWECKLVWPLWKKAVFSNQLSYTPAPWLSHSIHRYVPKRKAKVCPWKDLSLSVHISFIHNSPTLVQKFINQNQQTSGTLHSGKIFNNKQEPLVHTIPCINLKNTAERKEPDAKKYIWYVSIYLKFSWYT